MHSILGIYGNIQALIVSLTCRPIQVPLPSQRARLFSSDQAAAQRPISLKARSDSLTLGESACRCQALYFKTTFARMPGSGERVTQKIPTRWGAAARNRPAHRKNREFCAKRRGVGFLLQMRNLPAMLRDVYCAPTLACGP